MTSAYEQFANTHDMNNPAAVAQWNASQGNSVPAPAPMSKLQELSIGLAKGTITDQAGVNRLYGNEASGSAVPENNAYTSRYTSAPAPTPPVDPLSTLSPEQRAEFSKQFSIGLGNGSLKDQAAVDAFKQNFASAASGGSSPTFFSTQPAGNTNNAGQSGTQQNNVSGASGGGGGSYSRYGLGTPEKQAEDYLNNFQAPQSEEEIARKKLADAQAEINSQNDVYNSMLLDQSRANDQRSAETNAVSVLNGLSGSSEAGQRAAQTTALNNADNAKIQAQRGLALSQIYQRVRTDAATEARQQKLDANTSATAILARKDANMAKAADNAKNLAMSGATLQGLKATDPATYAYLAQSVGGESQLAALFTLNRPQESIIDKKVEGGKYVIAYQNPLTGKVRIESIDLKIPEGYDGTSDLGNKMMFYKKSDPNQHIFVDKGLSPDQAADNARQAAKDNAYGGANNPYKTDLDALIGNVPNLIQSKNGKEAFTASIRNSRNDADKINAIASVVLRNSPLAIRQDFISQTVGIKQLDQAIAQLDAGTKTGAINAGKQYVYNVVGKDFDPNLAAINAHVIAAIQPYRNSVTGAAWGQQEENEYQQLFGGTKYSPEELKTRLRRMQEILKDKSVTALTSQVTPMSDYNPFGSAYYGGSAGNAPQGGNIVTAPDGTQVQIID